MMFYLSCFCKKSLWQGLVVLAVSFCSCVVFAQIETNTSSVVQPVLVQTNATVALVEAETNRVGQADQAIAQKVIEISDKTKLAIAAFDDGVFPTANKLAREQLQKCTDFSSIDAELLFHIVMFVNQKEILGPESCIELLDSKEKFGEIWGNSSIEACPVELNEAAQFWKACCLADLNKRVEAIRILRELIIKNEFKYDFLRLEVLRRLCYELVLVGELEEAAVHYATKRLPPTTDPLCGESVAFFKLGYAQVLFQLNKPNEAEAVLKQLIEEQSSNTNLKATALLFNMELLLINGQTSNAVALFENSNNENLLSKVSPRVKSLLLCNYALALAQTKEKQAKEVEAAIATATSSVEAVYSSEERMFCTEILIQVLASTKHFDEVKQKLTNLLEYAPNSLYVARILRQVARNYQASGEYEQAFWAYQLYLHSFTKNPYEYDIMVDSGDCLVQLGRLNEAALLFKRASEIAGDDGKKNLANFKAGEAYYKSERYMQAADCFGMLVSGVKEQEQLLITGQLYHAQAIEKFDLGTAKIIYKQLAGSDNIALMEPALIASAALCVEDGELALALDFYTKLIELSSESPRESYGLALLGRGLVLLKTSRYADALASFEQAEQVKDGGDASIRAAFLKTEALYSLGHQDAAYSNTVAFLEKFPESPLVKDADFWLAKHDFNSYRYEQAEKRFLAFCNKWHNSPQAPIAHLLAIYAMMRQEKYDAVITETAIWADTYDKKGMLMLADVQYLNGEARSKLLQFDNAVRSYAQAAKNATSEELKQRAIMRQADCLYTLGADNPTRYEEAIPIYKELLASNQHHSFAMQISYKLAKCYEKQGKYDEAINGYYSDVVLQTENFARESDGVDMVNYLNGIGGSVWYSRAIIDATALYEKQGTPEALKRAEELLGRLVNTSLPFAGEAKMMLERIQAANMKLLISNGK